MFHLSTSPVGWFRMLMAEGPHLTCFLRLVDISMEIGRDFGNHRVEGCDAVGSPMSAGSDWSINAFMSTERAPRTS